jgi:hypothetical protein
MRYSVGLISLLARIAPDQKKIEAANGLIRPANHKTVSVLVHYCTTITIVLLLLETISNVNKLNINLRPKSTE